MNSVQGPMTDRVLARRRFITSGATMLGGAVLLDACGSGGSAANPAPSKRPPIGKESGALSLLEWGGYEAHGTKAQNLGLEAGKDYTSKFGTSGLTYTYITNDDQALQKATSAGPFDLMHPCNENIPDYVSRGLVQPFDTSLLPSFKQLNPFLVKQGQHQGKQYLIPWDWGYGSLTYRTDHVSESDATGWELAWNKKYSGKISLWSGASTNFEIAALKLGFPHMDNLTTDQLAQAKDTLLQQKPLNKFYWESEYDQMQPAIKSGTVWIAYSWQDTLVSMKAAKVPVGFMNPRQGRLSWLCGFMLGANTKNYYHAHAYVESFINRKSCAQMTNLFYYGTANAAVKPSDIKDKALVSALKLGDPNAIAAPDVHLQAWAPNRSALELAWQEVVAA
jgi:spermidine/putrescine transport system substrate-binding protein